MSKNVFANSIRIKFVIAVNISIVILLNVGGIVFEGLTRASGIFFLNSRKLYAPAEAVKVRVLGVAYPRLAPRRHRVDSNFPSSE